MEPNICLDCARADPETARQKERQAKVKATLRDRTVVGIWEPPEKKLTQRFLLGEPDHTVPRD
jgi:hypothetical protein